jgi:ubiquinone/menaquinone biosynthesis C-methylase UbiE
MRLPTLSNEELASLIIQRSPRDRRKIMKLILDLLVPQNFRPVFMPPDTPENEVPGYKSWELEYLFNVQSLGFTVEFMPYIFQLLKDVPKGFYTCLDVGTRTGAGADLFGALFGSHCSHLQIAVDTIDTDPTFLEYQMSRYKDIRNIMAGDVFQMPDQSYDFVLCSHTLEHIKEPLPFAQKLTHIAKKYAFFYLPYNEQNPIQGHFCVDDKIIDALNPVKKVVFDSWYWRKSENPDAMQPCVFFATKGGAA